MLGTVLFFAGFALTLVVANSQQERIISVNTINEARDTWEVSGNFTHGRRLISSITPGKIWLYFLEPTDEYSFDNLVVPIIIVDPYGGRTELEVIYASATPHPTTGEPRMDLFLIKLVSNAGGLAFEASNQKDVINGTYYYNEISGIVQYDGAYKVQVDNSTFGAGPPMKLNLEEVSFVKEHPYMFFVPVGVIFMGAGVAMPVWKARKRKSRRRPKLIKS